MLPVLPHEGIKAADLRTITTQAISSLQLMERAALGCADSILRTVNDGVWGDPKQAQFIVYVGMGNNGGDGLAIARLLSEAKFPVRIARVIHSAKPSADHASNLELARKAGIEVVELKDGSVSIELSENEVIIDAILGVGRARAVEGLLASVINAINGSGRPVIAIDLPSGIDANATSPVVDGTIVRAAWTLTIGTPKLALIMADHVEFIGHWELVPIDLELDVIDPKSTFHYLTEAGDVVRDLAIKPRFSHKGNYGHALFIAGSEGKMGAAVLTTSAALRSGAGLVTTHVPSAGVPVIQMTVPEAMCSKDQNQSFVGDLPELDSYSAIGIGPGLGSELDTKLVMKRLIQDVSVPIVLDADAINILAEEPTWIAFLPPNSILTPHPKEFDRLERTVSSTSSERLEMARSFAVKNKCIVVLKGAFTAICLPHGHVHFNPTGNPGMAKGGSGDVLTGLITGLLAQGYAPGKAAQIGVYLHGLAGDIAADHIGMDGMTAMDIVHAIPSAWRVLRNGSE